MKGNRKPSITIVRCDVCEPLELVIDLKMMEMMVSISQLV